MIFKRFIQLVAILAMVPAFAGELIISGAPAGATAASAAAPVSAAIIAPLAASAAPVAKTWEVRPADLNLATVFARWGKDAGYRVLWDARKNVMVEGTDRLSGSFEEAVASVLQGPSIALGSYPLEVCFYANTPPLARITRKGEQEKECN